MKAHTLRRNGEELTRLVVLAVALAALPLSGLQAVQTLQDGELDLSSYELKHIYSADFENPDETVIVTEDSLIENGERIPPPEEADWIYEGVDRAWIEDDTLWIGGKREHPEFGVEARYHSVLWNTRRFPENFLLEFDLLQTQKKGLNIVFFAASPAEGEGSIFQSGLPKRRAKFNEYTKGAVDSYHISYFATSRRGDPRGFSNMRKNTGFHKVADGEDLITEAETVGPHKVRLLKVGNRVTLEVNGRIALQWEDDGSLGGPPHGSGYIGLRQMRQSALCGYADFSVWEVVPQ